jgi:hypothetical protein
MEITFDPAGGHRLDASRRGTAHHLDEEGE